MMTRVRLFSLVVVLAMAGMPAAPAAADAVPVCGQVSVPVTIMGRGMQISGTLCRRTAGPPTIVQVLLPGGTYARYYWDFPYRPDIYSYVGHVLAANQATLAIDRLGTGQSSMPASEQVDVSTSISAVHQVIQALRQGAYGLPAVPRVVTVGHSAGSAIALWEAGTYHDVDGVVITGFLHGPPPGVQSVFAALYPAALDPKFVGMLDLGYLTTRPGQRAVFYALSTADPAVIALDELLKTTDSATLLGSGMAEIIAAPQDTPAWQITVPVLLAIGEIDAAFCPTVLCTADWVRAHEAPFYAHASRLDVAVIPQAGHDINLHPSAPDFYSTAAAWIHTIQTSP
jgi:pimeloyl-ACP methyl ester carboxylesterase